MKIAIIGAGISGLAAGRELASAGHEVVVFEKNHVFGGRMATRNAGKDGRSRLDYGISFLKGESSNFKSFLKELQLKDIVKEWKGKFAHRDEKGEVSYFEPESPFYVAQEGINAVGKYLGRMLDIRTDENVGGLTHLGEHRSKKRTWMINFSSAKTESVDAVILATPARQAYGLLNTTIDEIQTLNLVKEIDEIYYKPQYAFLAGYGDVAMPDWNWMKCDDEIIQWISNESTKRNGKQESSIVLHTTPEFTHENANADHELIAEKIMAKLAEMIGSWAALPEWKQVHFWKYSQAVNSLPYDYMEIEGKDTPLALVGDYLNGNTVETAYLSGRKLGKHWVEKYST